MTDDQVPADDGGTAEPIDPAFGGPGQGKGAAGPQFPDLGDLSDLGDLLGPEAAETIGTVAEEALKLFAVARDRFGEALADAEAGHNQSAGPNDDAGPGAAAAPWAGLLSQLAAGAVKAVEDFAAAAQEDRAESRAPEAAGEPAGTGDAQGKATGLGSTGEAPSGAASESGSVQPGEAAACSYCPICQGIALVRSVPTETWQRLAVSVVEMADAARNVADAAESVVDQQPGGRSAPTDVVIRQGEAPDESAGLDSVADFLRSLEPTEEPPEG